MGCSDSNAVQTNPKQKPSAQTQPLIKSIILQENDHYICGQLSEEEFLFMQVNLTSRSLSRMPLPEGLTPFNHSSMIKIAPQQYLISGGIDFSLQNITSECFRYDAATHSATKLANLKHPRYTHASLLLKEHVYVAGGRYFGEDDVAILKHCQKYSIAQNEWMILPQMIVSRCTCMLMAWQGQVFVFGGYTGRYQRDERIERLKKDESMWQVLDFFLNRGIESCFAFPSSQNQITLLGGNTNSGVTASVATIDFHSQTILNHSHLREPKMLHKAFLGANSQVFILGGAEHSELEVYSLTGQRSTTIDLKLSKQFSLESFQVLTQSQEGLFVEDGEGQKFDNHFKEGDEVILVFGTTEQPFILELNISVPYAQIHGVPLGLKLMANSGGVLLEGLKFILFGGIEDDSLSEVSNAVYSYDHSSRKVQPLAMMKQARYSFAYVRIGGKIYVAGGGSSTADGKLNILSQCQVYDIVENQWKTIASLPIPLMSPMAFEKNKTLHVLGGLTSPTSRNSTIYRYQAEVNQWEELKFHLPFGVEAASIVNSSAKQFLIFGGRLDNGDTDAIWSLEYLEESEVEYILTKKSYLSQKKSSLKVLKPKSQDFYLCLGGKRDVISCYSCQSMQLLEYDGLKRLSEMFAERVGSLQNPDMKSYLIVNTV